MNRHLQRIQDFIQHAATLSAEEKAVLAKAVKDTDTEITVTEFKLDRTEKVKRTTAILLEETIEELEQKRIAVEEKNRDLAIEASLERVRAVAMGMRGPDDMLDICRVISSQLETLNIAAIRNVQTAIIYEAKELYVNYEYYRLHDKTLITEVDYDGHPIQAAFVKQMLEGSGAFFKTSIEGKEVKEWLEYQKTTNVFIDSYLEDANSLNYYWYSMGPVALGMSTYAPLNAANIDIFERFRNVFGLAYTRYLDVETALTQAREAQIQLALERVRARTMAMRKSDELADTSSVLFQQIKDLGFETWSCGFCIWKGNDMSEVWMAAESGGLLPPMLIPYKEEPTHRKIYEASLQGAAQHEKLWEGDELAEHYAFLRTVPSVDNAISILESSSLALPTRQCYYVGFFKQGYLLLITKEPAYGAADLSKRFALVFEQTYTRFLDLQKAESQAREAIKQTSLDRVRGEIASMRTTQDLERIIPLVWNELTILGIPFLRCGVFIMDEGAEMIHTHLSTPDGEALSAFALPFDAEGIGKEILPAWRKKQMATLRWSAEEFASNTETLVSRRAVRTRGNYVTGRPNTTLELHFFPFLQGMLYVGNHLPLMDDEKDLVQSLADAFSTAYARYDDFNRLELAKQEVERTLTDLKAAQTRLIQSEKMASLGELTAGIAHEIQNPLNFVNNFSEVNQEMIRELEEELKAGNIEDALAIAADIRQNEEKINHHGKRAADIVKGMLQHSRSSAGEKQPANLNAIADEFLKLSYHGFRAKNKTFNAKLIADYDDTLPDINVLPQDIGRVMLNLFNNAFYAVSQKAKTAGAGYKPTVTVTTFAPTGGGWAAKVRDNGVGMPDSVKVKIMQPFFTTKPTGEGTGLGLSLTYDMVVKGHGGSIAVDTKEGEFTEFTITLPR